MLIKVLKKSQQNNSETVSDEDGKEIPKGRYISPEKWQEIFNDLRLKQWYNNTILENNKFDWKQNRWHGTVKGLSYTS